MKSEFDAWWSREMDGRPMAVDFAKQIAQIAWQASRQQAVPSGYVMVPVEPTDEMRLAGECQRLANLTNINPVPVYRAMLAAAPQAEQAVEPVEAMQLAFELGGLEDGSYHFEADELERVIKSAMDAAPPAPDVSELAAISRKILAKLYSETESVTALDAVDLEAALATHRSSSHE